QVTEGRIAEVDIKYSGEITKYDTASLAMALIKGLLTPLLPEAVNFINALSIAKSRGITINQTKTFADEDFINLITLKIVTDKQTKHIAATLSSDREARIVKIDDCFIEIQPIGFLIIIENEDKPGIIGNIGTLLGKNNVNIAAMTCGRNARGGRAINIVNIDSAPDQDILEKVKKIQGVLSAKLIKI
ncbi:MAG: ACT domain-containing protein, partial [Candidatus Omnitrophota bacterium]